MCGTSGNLELRGRFERDGHRHILAVGRHIEGHAEQVAVDVDELVFRTVLGELLEQRGDAMLPGEGNGLALGGEQDALELETDALARRVFLAAGEDADHGV